MSHSQMTRAMIAIMISSSMAGCSWLTDYGHCTVSWQCENCEEVEVQFEWVKSMDSKEAELPGG